MARKIAEAVMATAVFLTTAFLMVSGGSIVPRVFGSHLIGGLTAIISGMSLSVALYQWDSHFQVFDAEMHASNARGIGPKISSFVVSISSILAITGTLAMVYGLVSAVA